MILRWKKYADGYYAFGDAKKLVNGRFTSHWFGLVQRGCDCGWYGQKICGLPEVQYFPRFRVAKKWVEERARKWLGEEAFP